MDCNYYTEEKTVTFLSGQKNKNNPYRSNCNFIVLGWCKHICILLALIKAALLYFNNQNNDSGTEYRSLSDNSLIYSLTEDENGHSVQNLFGAAVTYIVGYIYDAYGNIVSIDELIYLEQSYQWLKLTLKVI